MRIREANEHDASGIAALLHAMADIRSIASEPAETTAMNVKANLRLASVSAASTVLVAESSEGSIAGYCAVHWVPFLFFAGGEAYITELFVRPEHSGHGIGSALLDTVIADARKRGCARLSLLNGRDGESYRRNFYAERGWVERDRMANFVFPLSNTHKRS